jgi:hypothetical protein
MAGPVAGGSLLTAVPSDDRAFDAVVALSMSELIPARVGRYRSSAMADNFLEWPTNWARW